jgi:hypothetical protein
VQQPIAEIEYPYWQSSVISLHLGFRCFLNKLNLYQKSVRLRLFLICPSCTGEMRIISFIVKRQVERKILEHLGLYHDLPDRQRVWSVLKKARCAVFRLAFKSNFLSPCSKAPLNFEAFRLSRLWVIYNLLRQSIQLDLQRMPGQGGTFYPQRKPDNAGQTDQIAPV